MTTEQSTAWGLTVSRRFANQEQADNAAASLKEAGFREEEIRIWHHKPAAVARGEDRMARTFEGILGGGVIGGLAGFFFSLAISWTASERTNEEAAAVAAIAGAVVGAVLVAIAVTIISPKFAFSHPHEIHGDPATVVTVTVGEREAEAKRVFDGVS